MGRKSKVKREINLLDLIPERTIEFEVGDDGMVALLAPRFRNRLLRQWIEPRMKQPFFRVKLDDIGSATWLLMDGERSVKEIAYELKERFGERIEPCYDRLGVFMRQLEGSRFICFVNLEECLQAKDG